MEITSDWGIIGPFVWINSREACANLLFPVDLGPVQLRLQIWGGFSFDGCVPKGVEAVSIR